MERPLRQVLGERITMLRRRLGLTQPALARKVGIGITSLSRIEKGHQSATGETIVALARVLETTTDFLLGLSEAF